MSTPPTLHDNFDSLLGRYKKWYWGSIVVVGVVLALMRQFGGPEVQSVLDMISFEKVTPR